MPTPLSEPAAWRVLAQRFAAPCDTRTPRGLCHAARVLYYSERIDYPTLRAMIERIEQHLPPRRAQGYAYEGGLADSSAFLRHRAARALAALWLAREAKEDA